MIGSAFLALLAVIPAFATDFHVKASRTGVVREHPTTEANSIARLERGDVAHCESTDDDQPLQQDSFYRITLLDGRPGWVSRYVVRVYEGEPEGDAPPLDESSDEAQHRAYHLSLGAPAGYMELINEGYVVGYDPRLKIPAWVQYRLKVSDIDTDRDRSNAFAADTRLPLESRSTLGDYDEAMSVTLWNQLGLEPVLERRPVYARGHLAPAADQGRTEEIEKSSYLLTNMAPQVHQAFNSGTWSALEMRVRQWTRERGEVTVIIGPVFEPVPRLEDPEKTDSERIAAADELVVRAQPPTDKQVIYNVVGEGDVAVPSAFFKVVVDMSPGVPDAIAFVISNHGETGRDLADHIVSIQDIENMTGLDLLSALPDEVEDELEKAPAEALW